MIDGCCRAVDVQPDSTTRLKLMNSPTHTQPPGPYGHNLLISDYLGVERIPPGVVIQHGWTPLGTALASDLANCRHLMLCWSRRSRRQWLASSSIPCRILGAPYVHYRRARNIMQDPNAKGTLAFPAHSIRDVRAQFDLDLYCKELRALPPEFQPITISLYYGDIMYYDLDRYYRKQGFDVVCSTAGTGKPAYESFYEQLRQHKYATSNEPGSYSFYAVEMGIPFFIHGELAVRDYTMKRNLDIPNGTYTLRDFPAGDEAYKMFTGRNRAVISAEQLEYVLCEIGLRDCAPAAELAHLVRDICQQEVAPIENRSLWARIGRIVRNPIITIQNVKDERLYRKHFR